MTSESKLLKVKNQTLGQGLKPKSDKIWLELRFNSYVERDIKLSLRVLEAWALKLSQALNLRNTELKKQTQLDLKKDFTMGKSESKSVFVARQDHDVVKALTFLHQASKIKHKIRSSSVLTVLRSPFVYKKTREQFAFQHHCYGVKLQCSRGVAELLVHLLSQLQFPCELKINLRA